MASAYKLIYLNARALGEPIRYIFSYLKISYEERLIPLADWNEYKKDFKWGQLPELHISGKQVLTQSTAISRYLANKYGLMPLDYFDAARCDMIVDALQDMRIKTKPFVLSKFFVKDGNTEKIKEQLMKEEFPQFFTNLNDILLETQKDKKGNFILGQSICWADFWLAHFTSWWEEILDEPDLLELYNSLKLQQTTVLAIPQIKERNAKRPWTII